jgi:hypothetical protein
MKRIAITLDTANVKNLSALGSISVSTKAIEFIWVLYMLFKVSICPTYLD